MKRMHRPVSSVQYGERDPCGFLQDNNAQRRDHVTISRILPIAVVQDDDIYGRQVDAEASSTRCE
jgi:hypothetical protein